MHPGKAQHVVSFRHAGRGLDQHCSFDAVARQDRRQIVGSEIAINRLQARRQPCVVAPVKAPEMLVAVDLHRWRAALGTGACGCSSPAARSSSQKAAGIFAFSICQWLAASAAERAPGMTLATTGWARQNCNAASGSATRWAA